MRRSTFLAPLVALAAAVSMHVIVSAQNPIQGVIGQNVNVVTGVADQYIGDMFKQRQNEAVSCIFAVNPDQQIFAYNDYRTVDEALDGQIGTPSKIQRSFFAKLFTPFRKGRPTSAAGEPASAQAWIGLSFTDNGTDYYTGLHPASPFSPVVPGDGQLKAYNFQAASDPVFAATPTHCLMAGVAFTPGGLSAGFVSRFTSTNNSETGPNVHYDWSKVITTSPPTLPGASTSDFFVDKPYIAAGANGRVVAAFVVFDESDPTKLSSKVKVFTSNDYGETWSAGVVVSQPLSRNQSPWILLDPNNENNVYIGWRVFANPKYPSLTNAIVGKRSSNGGVSFEPSVPYPVALLLRPYDAPQTQYPLSPVTPRSNAYPTAVMDSHGTISVFMQEYVYPATGYPLLPFSPLSAGKARITQTNSYDRGATWTLRRAFDYGPGSGPQFMPTAAVTGVPGPVCSGKTGPRSRIAVMYYDARASYRNGSVFTGGGGARFDVRIAQADPCYTDSGRHPIFGPSQQVSRYTLDGTPAHNIVTTPGYGYPAVNAVYRIFNSTKSFFTGDYIHVTPKIAYVLTRGSWKPTTAASVDPNALPAPVFKGVWADTRDLILPTVGPLPSGIPTFIDSLPWEFYVPPNSGIVALDSCQNGGSRDQNPFAAEISDGLYAAAPVTFRDSTVPRAFPVYVENRSGLPRFFRLTIDASSLGASFNIPKPGFTPDKTADVAIGKFSSVTGSVIVDAGFTSPVLIKIQEIVAMGDVVKQPGGLMTSVTLNTVGDSTGTPGETESRTPALDPTPVVTKPFGPIPPGGIVIGPNGPNPYVNPFGENPFGENPFGENPFGENPFGENPFGENHVVYDVTDVTFTASNQGTKAASFSAIVNVLNFDVLKANGYTFQALINRPSPTPGLKGCQTIEQLQPIQISSIKNPFGENPFGENPFGENPFGENPFGENPFGENNIPGDGDDPPATVFDAAASNSTLYLAPTVGAGGPTFHAGRPQDLGTYTLRVFQTVPNVSLPPAATFTPSQVTVGLVPHEPDVVPLPGGSFGFELTPEGQPVIHTSAAGAGIPTHLAFSSGPTSTGAGQTMTPPVTVTVLDTFNNPVMNISVAMAIANNPGGGTLSGTTTRITDVNGVATFDNLSIDNAGTGYTVVASSGNLTPAISSAFDITSNPLTILSLALPEGTQGEAYSQTVFAGGGTPPYAWSIVHFEGHPEFDLPSGLALTTLENGTGQISGTPDTVQVRTFRLKVTDNAGHFATQDLCIHINESIGGVLAATQPEASAESIAQTLVGEGVQIVSGSVTYSGAGAALGTFTGGFSATGLSSGVILSSGTVANVNPPNNSDSTTTGNGTPGDSDLNGLISVSQLCIPDPEGSKTCDAAVLEFDFKVTDPDATVVKFDYVFASEEYNEFVNSTYNDVFGFFVSGPDFPKTNLALIPGTNTPVSINNINGGNNPFGQNATNPAFYINNDLQDGSGSIGTQADGLTTVLSLQATIVPNQAYHMKIAIADAGDHSYDSWVMIKANSLSAVCKLIIP